MSFTALSSAWLFALLVPLIIFYFLKLKRPRQIISSLVLWRQVLSDQRVNSPFQKFKRNLLLLLQILLLTLLALAAMQPFLRREAKRAAQAEQRAWDSGLRKLSNKICEVLDNGVCTFDASGYLVPAR